MNRRHHQNTVAAVRACIAIAGFIALCAALTPAHANLNVGENGTVSYSYPIGVPPGIGGAVPRVGLSYSSGGRAGVLGWNWSLEGLSSISRCPPIHAIDNKRAAVNLDANDKFCFEGQRLIRTDSNGIPLADQQTNYQNTGTTYAEYRTERDTYTRVRAYGQANGAMANGPAYFKVWTKDGRVIEYGNTTDSRVAAQGSNVIYSWAINRSSDVLSNYMDYVYETRDIAWGTGDAAGVKVGRETRPIEIRYTGNLTKGQAPANSVKFIYEPANRSDAFEAYVAGSKMISVSQLRKIVTFAQGVGVRTVMPQYETNATSKRVRIKSIQECAGATTSATDTPTNCLPAPQFGYSPGYNTNFTVPAAAPNGLASIQLIASDSSLGAITGDFDGDGKTDIIQWKSDGTNRLFFARPANAGGVTTPNFIEAGQAGGSAASLNLGSLNLADSKGCYSTYVVDINGDGLSDLLRWATPTGASYSGQGVCGLITDRRSLVFFSKGDGSFSAPVDISSMNLIRFAARTGVVVDSETGLCAPGQEFMFGDFDGDGRKDLLISQTPGRAVYGTVPRVPVTSIYDDPPLGYCDYSPTVSCTNCTRLYKGNGHGGYTQVATNLASTPLRPDLQKPTTLFTDLDGSGMQGIVAKGASKRWLSLGDGNFTEISNVGVNCSIPEMVTDVNGDGKPDLICPLGSTSNALFINTGRGQYFAASNFGLRMPGGDYNLTTDTGEYGAQFGDLDGDGTVDALRWHSTSAGNEVFLSDGRGGFTRVAGDLGLNGFQLKHYNRQWDMLLGDFTGRGRPEILRIGQNPADNRLLMQGEGLPADMLVSVTSPLGAASQIEYMSLAQAGAPYASGRTVGVDPITNSTYPKATLNSPMYVATKVSFDGGGNGETQYSRYWYSGLKVSFDGRGLLGFAEVRSESAAPNGERLTGVTRYSQDFPFTGVPLSSESHRASIENVTASTWLGKNTNAYCDKAIKVTPVGDAGSLSCPESSTTASLIRRPYALRSFKQARDTDGTAMPSVTTVTNYDNFGNPLTVTTTTSGNDGLGNAQTASSTVTNTYLAPVISDSQWLLSRLSRASVSNTTPDQLVGPTAGAAANAAATQGVPPPGYQAPPRVNPAVLQAILQLLLAD